MGYIDLHVSPSLQFLGTYKPFKEARYVVLGFPFDLTSTYRAGSRFGPRAIREASMNIETYSFRMVLDAADLPICDLGDLHVTDDIVETLGRLKVVVNEVFEAGKFPVILGGEHTLTLGVVQAFEGDVGVLSFDAHMDLRDEYLGSRLSHTTFMRRVCELIGAESVVEVGVRAVCEEELKYAKESGLTFLTTRDVCRDDPRVVAQFVRDALSGFKRVYLTIDMDVLDSAYAPAVGNPIPEGLSPSVLLDLLQEIWDSRIVGFDVVEVSPQYDSGLTSIQAAHIISEALCFVEKTL